MYGHRIAYRAVSKQVFTSGLEDKIMANCQNSYTVRVRNAELTKERSTCTYLIDTLHFPGVLK